MTWPANLTDAAYATQVLTAVAAGQAFFEYTRVTSSGAGHTGEFLIFTDALKIDGARVSVSAKIEQQIADLLGAMLLTPKLADMHYAARTVTIPPYPMTATPADLAAMGTSDRMVLESQKMDAALAAAGSTVESVVGTVGKHWVLAKVLASAASGTACNYGWYLPAGTASPWQGVPVYASATTASGGAKVIQQPGTKHNSAQIDYSQQCVLASRVCWIDGVERDLQDVYQDPVLSALVSHEGPVPTRQPDVPVYACPAPSSGSSTNVSASPLTVQNTSCPLPPVPTNIVGIVGIVGGSPAGSFPWGAALASAAVGGLGAALAVAAVRHWKRSQPAARGRRSNPLPGLAGALVPLAGAGAALGAWETAWWARRRGRRGQVYQAAQRRAAALGRPLVVVGAPDGGVTAGYGCGDVTVDLAPSLCPRAVQADVTQRLPFEDGSAVVFVSCVLEYVSDAQRALAEIVRVSGGEAFFVGVEPWTLTAALYPGARRSLPAALR